MAFSPEEPHCPSNSHGLGRALNILQCQIYLLETLADNVLPADARASPVCRWWIELVDDFGRVVIRLWQNMTKLANIVLSGGVKEVFFFFFL